MSRPPGAARGTRADGVTPSSRPVVLAAEPPGIRGGYGGSVTAPRIRSRPMMSMVLCT